MEYRVTRGVTMKINTCQYCAGELRRNGNSETEYLCKNCFATFDIDDIPRKY
jgi:hypothetical protein